MIAQATSGKFNVQTNNTTLYTSTATLVNNTWYHIAVVRSGTGTNQTAVYINGASDGTFTNSTVYVNPFNTIGAASYTAGAAKFPGYISNMRIVNGTALYSSNFVPSTAALTATYTPSYAAQIVLQTAQSSTIIDNSFNNFTITNTGTVTAGNSVVPFAGTYSYSFDGSSQYLSLASNTAFDQNGAFTFECWVYRNSTSTNGYFMAELLSGYLCLGYNSSLQFFVDKSYISTPITSSSTFAINTWHHVALAYDGTTTRLFVNGSLQGSVAGGGVASGATLSIGRYLTGTNYFPGYISNVRWVKGTALYTTAFTPTTLPLPIPSGTQLLTCQYPEIMDVSVNHFAITNSGSTPAATQNPFGNYYASFNGSNQYLTIPSNAAFAFGTGDFTIEGWFYPTSSTRQDIISFDDATANRLSIICISNTLYYYRNDFQIASSAYSLNAWFHFAVVRNSGVTKVYINGVQSGISYTDTYSFPAQPVTIGRDSGGGGTYVTGYLSNIRVVKGTAVYTSNFTPPATPLTAITNTALLTCQYADIVDASINSATITNTGTVTTYLTDIFSGIVSGVNYAQKNYSLSLNGSSQYITVPTNASWTFTGTFTIEGWFQWTSTPVAGAFFGYQASGGLMLYINATSLTLSPNVFGTGNVFTTSFVPSINTWYHIALTRNSSNVMTLYVNGVSVGTATTSAAYTQGALTIGNATAFAGYMSNIRLTNTNVYTGAFTPSTTPLRAITGTSLLTAQYNTLFDASSNKFALTRVGNADMAPVYPFPA